MAEAAVAADAPDKRDRTHQAKFDIFLYSQACPRAGCFGLITWQEIAETEPHTKPLRPPSRTIKQRFNLCCECTAASFKMLRRRAA